MTLSPKLGVVGIITLWHFRLTLPIQMFIKVASSPRLSGIGMPSLILWSHPLKMQRIVLLSSLLWWELGTNSLITGPGEWLSFRRFSSKLSWSWSWTHFFFIFNSMVYRKYIKAKQLMKKCKYTDSSYVEVRDVTDLKLRPVVAGPSCLTHRLSNVLDILVRPFKKHVKSNLPDTNDFINNLTERVQQNTLLATFDIQFGALYSNIPHELGMEAARYWFR